MLIWYKTSIICPELHHLAKMARLAKIRQVFAKTPFLWQKESGDFDENDEFGDDFPKF